MGSFPCQADSLIQAIAAADSTAPAEARTAEQGHE